MKVGFIGLGNMGTSLARAVSKVDEVEILLSDYHLSQVKRLQEEIGGELLSNEKIAQVADVIFLGVKPHLVGTVLSAIKERVPTRNSEITWISMAAGISLAELSGYFPKENWIRMMPNTPVAIGKGMTTFTTTTEQNRQLFHKLMSHSGQVKELKEELMDAATAIAGCGPAFVYQWIEAMSRAGVENSLSSSDAQFLATQTLIGSAYLVRDSQKHPAQLTDEVASPGGATIAALSSLEETGFRYSIITAVNRAVKRTRKLRKYLNKTKD